MVSAASYVDGRRCRRGSGEERQHRRWVHHYSASGDRDDDDHHPKRRESPRHSGPHDDDDEKRRDNGWRNIVKPWQSRNAVAAAAANDKNGNSDGDYVVHLATSTLARLAQKTKSLPIQDVPPVLLCELLVTIADCLDDQQPLGLSSKSSKMMIDARQYANICRSMAKLQMQQEQQQLHQASKMTTKTTNRRKKTGGFVVVEDQDNEMDDQEDEDAASSSFWSPQQQQQQQQQDEQLEHVRRRILYHLTNTAFVDDFLTQCGDLQSIANLSWSLARLFRPDLLEILLGRMMMNHTATTTSAVSAVPGGGGGGRLQALLLLETKKGRRGRPRDVATLAWACATLGSCPSVPTALQILDAHAAHWLVEHGSMRTVSMAAWAFCTERVRDSTFWGVLEQHADRLVDDATDPLDVALLAWSCAVVGNDDHHRHVAPNLLTAIARRWEWIEESNNEQAFHTLKWSCKKLRETIGWKSTLEKPRDYGPPW